jgi:hypothetical protein
MTAMDSRQWYELQQLYSEQGFSLTAETVNVNNRIRITVGMGNH